MHPNCLLISVDVETTGFSFMRNDLIEIGACTRINGQLCRFDRLIQNQVRIPRQIQKLTGINTQLLNQQGKKPQTVIRDFLVWVKEMKIRANTNKIVFIGHNLIKFDIPFLMRFFEKYGQIQILKFHAAIVTVRHDKSLPKHNLGTLYKLALGKPLLAAHRADVDAQALLEVYESAWFQQRFGLFITNQTQRAVTSEYYERKHRLGKLRNYVNQTGVCRSCLKVVSPYFEHVHTVPW
jgi:DNA polymerase III alpha subunit (gram-positive type)